ncbi:unnamed protein product [marine sediment metagenome]|uniref:Uncharacterized protein n=1 Tax=marine sediment metagenome TaxID=412755 RepID=X1D8G7_9ZZZZ
MYKSIREERKARERDLLIGFMNSAKPKTTTGLKSSVKKMTNELKRKKQKILKMPEEEFRQAISRDIFGVASKSFYTSRIDKDIDSLENIVDRVEYLVSLRCEGSIATSYVEKETFKGRMKEGISLLDEFTPKRCICINDFVKKNKDEYTDPKGHMLAGGKRQKQMHRDAMRACK